MFSRTVTALREVAFLHQRLRHVWQCGAYRCASLAGMSSECTAPVARDASRSVQGVLRERPGAPRERPKRRRPSHQTYRNSVQEPKAERCLKNCQPKTQMFQKKTNLTTILAVLEVPTTLFGGSSAHGTRQRAPQGCLGGRQVWRDHTTFTEETISQHF